MCKIGIKLNSITPSGTQIESIVAQYRKVGDAQWIAYPITLSNPTTPDLTIIGTYEVQINVTNNLGDSSGWQLSPSFRISANCNPILTCDEWTLGKWGVVGNFGTISVTYIDCDGATQTTSTSLSIPITICAKQITSYDLGGDIPPENTPPIQIVEFDADFKGLKGYLGKTGVCNETETIEPTPPPVQGCSQWHLLAFNTNDQFPDDVYVKYLDCLGNTDKKTAQVSHGAGIYFYAYTPVEIFLGGQVFWRTGDGPWPTTGPAGSLTVANGNLTWNGTEWV